MVIILEPGDILLGNEEKADRWKKCLGKLYAVQEPRDVLEGEYRRG